jgi:hypothetical protein
MFDSPMSPSAVSVAPPVMASRRTEGPAGLHDRGQLRPDQAGHHDVGQEEIDG